MEVDFGVALREIVNKVRRRSKYNKDNHVHHIVPQTHQRAKEARVVLELAGIKPKTDERNLVLIRQNLHAHMHTRNYVDAVNDIFKITNTNAMTIQTLATLKTIISNLNNWVNATF